MRIDLLVVKCLFAIAINMEIEEDGSPRDHADSKSAQPGATPGFSATIDAAPETGWKKDV